MRSLLGCLLGRRLTLLLRPPSLFGRANALPSGEAHGLALWAALGRSSKPRSKSFNGYYRVIQAASLAAEVGKDLLEVHRRLVYQGINTLGAQLLNQWISTAP
jgi:hypothetical protein